MADNELRWATRADLESVIHLLQEYHRQEGLRRHSEERLRGLLDDLFDQPGRGRILLAEARGEPAGYALLVRRFSFEWASEVAVLDEIFVRGLERGRGLGRRMVGYCEDYAASEGLPAITLEVSLHNVNAREFYRSTDFVRVDREIYARQVSGPR